MNALNIKSWADVRALLHVIIPAVMSLTVAYGFTNENNSVLIGGLLLALVDPALSIANTQNGFRKYFYGILNAAQALLLGLGIFTDAQLGPIVTIIGLVLGGVAAANTDTSASTGRHAA